MCLYIWICVCNYVVRSSECVCVFVCVYECMSVWGYVCVYMCNMNYIIDDHLCDHVRGMCVCAAYMCVHTRDRRRAPIEREEDIQHDDHAVVVMKNGAVVGHVPRSLS